MNLLAAPRDATPALDQHAGVDALALRPEVLMGHEARAMTAITARTVSASASIRADRRFCAFIGRHAVRSLYAELTLYPKPGLVSLVDNGSHRDMTAATFLRSLFALRGYFIRITMAGMDHAPFAKLVRLGIDAEQRMLGATGGINTHRGAIFALGLLCAAIGSCRHQRIAPSANAVRAALLASWGRALAHHAHPPAADSHGLAVARRYAASGARDEAARGMPSVFEVALPTLRRTLASGGGMRRARIDALFALIGHVSDTNLYHRGGRAGARMAMRLAREFIAEGGTGSPGWETRAKECHRIFVANRLSPGGAADLLAAACLVLDVEDCCA